MHEYFSDRENGPKARIEENISPEVWKSIAGLIENEVALGSFGESYPKVCKDGTAAIGTNEEAFSRAMMGMMGKNPTLVWPLQTTRAEWDDDDDVPF
jgi:hypothetical protein